MPKNEPIAETRSQKLTSAREGMVSLDRKTCHELNKRIGKSIDQLQTIRYCEIMLSSLECHLSELADDRDLQNSFEIGKGILLLKYWTDCVPEFQAEIASWLQEAFQMLQVIMAASELGGEDE